MDNLGQGLIIQMNWWLSLAEKGQDGRAAVTANDWHPNRLRINAAAHMRYTNVDARTMSRVVTPKSRVGSNAPALRSVSAATGTVEFTGFVTMHDMAPGHTFATSEKISRTMLALV
jgi:hypothetical protein